MMNELPNICLDHARFLSPQQSMSAALEEWGEEIIPTTLPDDTLHVHPELRKTVGSMLTVLKTDRSNGQQLVLLMGKTWRNGRRLRVRFLDGTPFLRSKVQQFARVWEDHAHIHFDFIDTGDAEIRIAFAIGKGSWSYVGTDALSIKDQQQPTMNYGWFDESTDDSEFGRTVIHEFGHALGCVHEHQHPTNGIPWNKEQVYADYAKMGWNKEQVDKNVFERYNATETNHTSACDLHSIMMYPIPNRHTIGDMEVRMNHALSGLDKSFIASCYPKP